MTREEAIRLLVGVQRPLSQLADHLSSFEWDWDGPPIARISGQHIVSVLKRYTTGEIGGGEIEAWANLLEAREDIEFSTEAASAIFDLANPELQGRLVDIVPTLIGRL